MQAAWRERVPAARVKAAHLALEKNAECVTALIMLAEEEAPTMLKVEKILRKALKLAEANYKKTQKSHHLDSNIEMQHSNILFYDSYLFIYHSLINNFNNLCIRKKTKI
jgi:hypothetical protein